MLTVINEGVKMHCKEPWQCFTLLGFFVETITYIANPKGSLEVYTSIVVTFNSPVVYSSLFSSFFFRSMLITNIRYYQSRVR